MVFNVTFNNISVISWRSIDLFMELDRPTLYKISKLEIKISKCNQIIKKLVFDDSRPSDL